MSNEELMREAYVEGYRAGVRLACGRAASTTKTPDEILHELNSEHKLDALWSCSDARRLALLAYREECRDGRR